MTKADQVWIVDDDRSIRWVLEKALQKAGIETRSFSSADGLLEGLGHALPEAIITDIRMPGLDGLALAAAVVGASSRSVCTKRVSVGIKAALRRPSQKSNELSATCG